MSKGKVFESVRGKLFSFDADIYVRHWAKNLVGYKSENGPFKVIEKNGLLGFVEADSPEEGIMNVELFEDISGEYFPLLTEADEYYSQRPDGKIEKIKMTGNRTSGKVVKSIRGKIK